MRASGVRISCDTVARSARWSESCFSRRSAISLSACARIGISPMRMRRSMAMRACMLPEPISRATRSSSLSGAAMRRAMKRENVHRMNSAKKTPNATCDGGLCTTIPNERRRPMPSATVMKIAVASVKKMRRWRRQRRIDPLRMPTSHFSQW